MLDVLDVLGVAAVTIGVHVGGLAVVPDGMVNFRDNARRRAAVYLRCSTDRGHTDNQRPAVLQLAKARDFEVVEVFEENVSAVKARPEWQRLRAAAHEGKLDAVLVFALDRLGRSLVGNLQGVLDFDRLGVQVISVREPWLDMGGPVRELLVAIFSWVAAEERRQIASRCQLGQERARRQGKHCGRPKAAVDLDQALLLRRRGISIRKAAKKLGVSPSVLHRALQAYQEGVPKAPGASP